MHPSRTTLFPFNDSKNHVCMELHTSRTNLYKKYIITLIHHISSTYTINKMKIGTSKMNALRRKARKSLTFALSSILFLKIIFIKCQIGCSFIGADCKMNS